ncbi:FHA domain-containing protein [bacterium]|nr:FHA domain-containing protein [bacterium]
MAFVTLRVLHGADRGKVFERLSTPVSVGREEGNTIQLNDERISRYHLKLQEDEDKVILTDLESTNGTKVNGEDVQVRIVRHGDMIALGRSLLLFGSRTEIDRRIAEVASRHASMNDDHARQISERIERIARSSDVVADASGMRSPLLPAEPPPLPDRLGPAQAAELAEVIDYIQSVLRNASEGVMARPGAEKVELDFADWQTVLDLQSRLADTKIHGTGILGTSMLGTGGFQREWPIAGSPAAGVCRRLPCLRIHCRFRTAESHTDEQPSLHAPSLPQPLQPARRGQPD